jgi:hypothetical protein
MSLQFCYTGTPNVEEETFRWLVLFDHKIDISEWNAIEAEITAGIAAAEVDVAALETAIDELNRMVLQLRCDLRSLGV